MTSGNPARDEATARPGRQGRMPRVTLRDLGPYAVSVGFVAIAALIAESSTRLASAPSLTLVFLVAVVVSAGRYGLWPAIFTSVLSVLCWDFFFTLPYYTLYMSNPRDVVALVVFLTVSLIVGGMTARIRRQGEQLVKRARDIEHARMSAETERLRNALLMSVSHDLRTPLTAIIGALTAIESAEEPLDPATRSELVTTARGEAERLNRFVGNLLDVTRLESGNLQARIVPTDVADVVEAVLERGKSMLTDHIVEVALPDDLPLVGADSTLLEQVVFNLLDNAAKYSPPHSKIQISAAPVAGDVEINVADEGPGIPDGAQERIFDKFTRFSLGDRVPPGTGLGLMISRGFLTSMNGTIRASGGAGGRGAVFSIRLHGA